MDNIIFLTTLAKQSNENTKNYDNEAGIDHLRSVLGKPKIDDRFELGTVIRWTMADKYTYVALKAGDDLWVTTSKKDYFVKSSTDFDGLIEMLSHRNISNIEVATAFEAI